MSAPSRIEIPLFPNGKRIAVTTSFDDGHIHDRRIVAAFNEWGLKGTFNLCSGSLGRRGTPTPDAEGNPNLDACEVAALYRGHEVAIHTVSHPWLNLLSPTDIAREVLEDRQALEDLVGYPVRGMAYPFGVYNEQIIEILRALGIVYCRTVENAPNCFPPRNPLAWQTTAHQYAENPTVPEQFKNLYDNPRATGLFYVWGHGFEFNNKNDWQGLERIYKPISGKPDVWYCTNIELFDYEAARSRLVIGANRAMAFNPSALTVSVSADGKLVDIPPGQTVQFHPAIH